MPRPLLWILGVLLGLVAAFYALNAYIYNEKQGDGSAVDVSVDEAGRMRGDVVPTGLVGGGWTWVRTNLPDATSVEAPAGGQFVISFDEDGLVASTTDCNSMSGSYVRTDDTLTFGPMAMTKMYCEGSKEGEYARQLALVSAYVVDGSGLRLVLANNGGTMVFARDVAPTNGKVQGVAPDPKNASYLVGGERATLVDGVAVSGSDDGETKTTRYFGNQAIGDVNGDGRDDVAFILTQEAGGSGTFYYIAVALAVEGGYIGTNAVLLGDRIAPQPTAVKNGQIIANFADRKSGEPMTTAPTVGVSKYFVMSSGELVEIPAK